MICDIKGGEDMVNQFIVKFMNGFTHYVNCANAESAKFISQALFPGLKIVSIETGV